MKKRSQINYLNRFRR